MNRSTKTTNTRNRFCANDEDYISKLPELIISQILSSMPTKDAVRTSVLSKDWEYRWHSIYNINVADTELFSGRRSNRTSFTNFVNRLLFHIHELRSFRLSIRHNYDIRQLVGWVCAALKSNIECFELHVPESIGFVLPLSLHNNTSLRILKLKSLCTFCVPRDNYFPNLTYLHLRNVVIHNKHSNTDPLVFTFPALKTFKVKKCFWLNVNLVEIRSPALSTFVYETARMAGDISMKICGARLERFESVGGFPENIIFYETTVLNLYLRNNPEDKCTQEESVLNAQKLLKWFSSATFVHLSQWTYMVMALAKQELLLPKYDRLQRLTMCVWRDTKLLFELLHSAPSLKYLKIIGNWEVLSHDEVDCVPHCVASHLEELELESINDKPLFDLAFFFLTNGVVLKKVCIDDHFYLNARYVEKISMYPRASAGVEIVIG